MSSLVDARYAALSGLGLTGSINEMLLAWYQALGATSNNINTARRELLDGLGYAAEKDMRQAWLLFLRDVGYTPINNGEMQFWIDYLPPTAVNAYPGMIFGDSLSADNWQSAAYGTYLDTNVTPQKVTLRRHARGLATTSFIKDSLFTRNWTALGAKFTIIQGGINDIMSATEDPSAEIQANISHMVNAVKNSGQMCVVIGPGPAKNNGLWTSTRQTWIDSLQSWLSTTFPNEFFDVYSILEDPANADELLPAYDVGDGLHFTAAAYQATDAALAPRFDGVL